MIFQKKLLNSLEINGPKIAIEHEGKEISYSSLLSDANRITQFLLSKQLEAGTVIGIELNDRSNIICSIIGVVNARCVFVLLDGSLPSARIEHLITELGLQYVITAADTHPSLASADLKGRWQYNEVQQAEEAVEDHAYPEPEQDDSLYIYFTSGSTGTPKGIIGKNCSLLQFLQWEIDEFGIDENSRFSQLISPYFDAFLRDVFTPLLAGGTICIPPDEEDFFSSEKIIAWIDNSRISTIHCVPSLFRIINQDTLTSAHFENLRHVLMSGEKINPSELAPWYEVFRDRIQLANLYGATEATMIRSCYKISPADVKRSRMPIGTPIADTRLLIARKNMAPASTLVPGDLYIISDYLTKGYLNRPDLTNERFIKINEGTPEETMAYKTGDRARKLAGGQIELLGREDRQVKLRGIRVELDEIEVILMKSGLLQNAVVILNTEEKGQESLMAFLIKKDEAGENADLQKAISEYMESHIPAYMIPSNVVLVKEYPLLPNGKINLKSLLNYLTVEREVVLPVNETEEKVLSIWKEILVDRSISTDDSFHKIGGNSLSLMSLIARINKEFKIRISLSELFKNPTIQQQAALIENASNKNNDSDAIPVAPKADGYVLSSSQKRLFFLHKFDPASIAYNMPSFFKLEGEISKDHIQSVFEKLIRRHESLRTSFELIDGEVEQRVADQIDFEVECFSSDEEEAQSLIQDFVKPFDLSSPCLIRVSLIDTSLNQHVLMLDLHHIITDGVSQEILVDEFMALYNGESLPELKLNYKDFAVWQQSEAQQKRVAEQSKFWQKEFSREVEALDLPTDFVRPAIKSNAGGSLSFGIGKEETSKLESIAEREGVTMYMVMLSAYYIFISKLCNQEDIVVGTPIAGRHQPDIENIFGMFVNTLSLRNNVKGDLNYKKFLSLVKSRTLACLENQDYPYEELIEALKVKRDTSRNPLFDVMFSYQNYKQTKLEIPELSLSQLSRGETLSKFDLTLFVSDNQGQLILDFEYSTALFKEETIQRFIGHFKKVVSAITAEIDTKIADIEIVSDHEKAQLLNDFNNTDLKFDKGITISSSFEKTALEHRDKTALVFKDEKLSYAELDARSNQLARKIREHVQQRETFVGIMMERSPELIVSMMGVLKSGCAYVPIDPEYPIGRIKHIVGDSKLEIILVSPTSKEICDELSEDVVPVDVTSEEISQESKEPLNYVFSSSNLAYLIYTSGSTGRPKGVMVTHRNVINFVNGIRERIAFEKDDSVLSLTTASFDIFVLETILPLLNGLEVVLASAEEQKEANALYKLIKSQKVDCVQITPVHLKLLLSGNHKDVLSDVKVLMVGGEAFPQKLLEEVQQCHSGKIYNMYGPTETTVWSTVKDLTDAKSINIGTPIANTTIRILDSHRRLQAVGIPGELYIGGEGVSKGYWGLQKLTKAKFIKDPVTGRGTIYHTGDRAKWLPDGSIEFLGRTDNQVKISGHRIELGEIESQLSAHDPVEDTVVVKGGEEHKYLIAYYVSKVELSVRVLREFLKNQLPEYMLPSFFVRLDSLPLTPNGKLDKKALPEPELKAAEDFLAPSGETEEKLVEIWSEALGIRKEVISIDSSFFELGGHSILAIKLISRIQDFFGIHLGLPAFFMDPSIKAVSEKIHEGSEGKEALPEISVDLEHRYDPFPLTDVQQAYWIGRKDLFDFGGVGTHAYSETFVPDLNIDNLNKALQLLIERHEMLRMVVNEDGEQSILKEVPLFEAKVLDLNEYPEEEGEALFYDQRNKLSHHVFPGAEWPLFDIRVTKFRDSTYKVHYSMDALIMDAGSSVILFNEFMELYTDLDTALPPISISFRDYVRSEVDLRKSSLFEESKSYWLSRAEGMPFAPDLPLMPVENQPEKPNFERHDSQLNKADWDKLQDKAKRMGVTPSILLIGSFAEVLNRWSKSSHFTLNLTLFNRIPFHEDVDKLIGDFTSLTLLEIDFREIDAFAARLQAIQNRLWQDLEHKYFSGVEVQREMSRHHGHSVIIPVVITSTLGLDDATEDEDEQKVEVFHDLDPMQESYSITQTPQVWIDFQLGETAEGLWFNWDSVEGLFPAGMVREMFASYDHLLKSLVNDDELWGSNSLVFLPAEQKEARALVNATTAPQEDKLLHELFSGQAGSTPDAVAILSNTRQLTYGELDTMSHVLGGKLRKLGAVPNRLVAIVMEKSWEQVAASLGILYSGAAYLPIGAELPEERVMMLLEQGEVDIILTTPEISKRFTFPEEKSIVLVEDSLLEEKDWSPLQSVQQSGDLAYVIFTSGSTGMPKGVMIDHTGAVNTVLDINSRFKVGADDRVLAISSLSFDLSVYDIFGLLGAGGAIVLPEQDELRSPDRWIEYIQNHQVTLWNTVPALMQMMVDYNQEKVELPLRLAMLSGDWIPLNLPDGIKASSKDIEVISLGGATEASIWSIFFPIGEVESHWKSIPYGKPLLNQSFHVLKPDLTDCPDQVAGDLYIGGIGLARGYWRDEEKTANSFIVHPVSGERLYKTGDLGRYLADGNIEFLGREDNQVKVQGYRIELGEIEAAIDQHEGVRESTVIASDSIGNTKELVAYVVSAGSEVTGDSIGDATPEEGTIEDKRERAVFKLERHGLRSIDNAISSIPFSRPDQGSKLKLRSSAGQVKLLDEPLTLSSFSEVFNSLLPQEIEGLALPKYYYPSAGSLYPVQTYVSVNPGMIDGVPGGYYYYHPASHSLELLTARAQSENGFASGVGFSLHLVSDMSAIRPLYGAISEMFSHQEAGYMSNLLMQSTYQEVGLQVSPTVDKESIAKNFNLTSDHLHLVSFSGGKCTTEESKASLLPIFDTQPKKGESRLSLPERSGRDSVEISYLSRKSYREFEGQGSISTAAISRLLDSVFITGQGHTSTPEGLNVYLYVKEDKLEGLTGGAYYVDVANRALNYLGDQEATDLFAGNELIYDASGFAIMLTVNHSVVKSEEAKHEMMYWSGYIGQNLMNHSTEYQVGLCAVGSVDEALSRELLQLSSGEEVLHSFLGGKVTEEQIENTSQLTVGSQAQSPEELLKEYLSEQLPAYMIPKYYVQIDQIPLTANGKVNKKALPSPDIQMSEGYVAASNETEEQLVAIWSEVLEIDHSKISINSSFFELGGNSILAIKLTNQIQEALSVKLSLPDFFRNPSIEGLTTTIEATSNEVDKGEVRLPKLEVDLEHRYDPFPMTDVQQAYWIGRKDLFDFGGVGTHGYMEFWTPDLNIDRLNKALQLLIERHEMLRMVVNEDGEQSILKEVPLFEAKVLDLNEYPEEEGKARFYDIREELSHQVFTGEEWPLFDIRVTKFKDGSYKVHYSMDALIMDVGSSIRMNDEFSELYTNLDTVLPPISISFRDYVQSEISLRKSSLFEESKSYWLSRAEEMPFTPDLPLMPVEYQPEKPNFERHDAHLNKADWDKLQDKAKRLGVTPTILLIGSFAEVLNRWSKSSHFTLNLTLFNRIPFHEDVDKLIGDFTSLTLLEIDFREIDAFAVRLQAIQNRLWQDLEHKYFSGVEVQREMSRHHGHSVIIPVVITSTLGLGKVSDSEDEHEEEVVYDLDPMQEYYSITQTPQVWIDFQLGENAEGLWFNWDSVEGLFPAGMIKEMFASYDHLLKSLVNDDELWGSNSLVFLPAEQKEARALVNATTAPQEDKLLHELFSGQAGSTPDAVAIVSNTRQLTYGELDTMSHVLGGKLRKLGAVPNRLVAIVMEKSWEQVAASLGILYSGAAYLPIGAELPEERVMMLLEQGEVDIILTTPEIAKRFTFPEEKSVVLVEDSLLEEKDWSPLQPVQQSGDLAYVIFTSGSTGMPKGVMIDHTGAVNTVLDINSRFKVGADDRVLAISSLSFDLSVYDIFGLLGAGGAIVLPEQDELRSPDRWIEYIQNHQVTLWNTVPALMQMMVDYNQEKVELPLRLAMLSGDWIPLNLPDGIKASSKDIEVISLGGATEASIWSIFFPIGEVESHWKSIPYGKPLLNQSFHVLKPDLTDCPDQVAGDLYIGGIGLARGYWRDEEKTANSFIVHPVSGERLYKTGDLGRYLADGNIEFLGREDNQVKVQGYRIELGEIEAAIDQHEGVRESTVIASDSIGNTKELVAYVVSAGSEVTGDSIGDATPEEGTIEDKRERAVFKLERHGLRSIDNAISSIPFSRPDQGSKLKLRSSAGQVKLLDEPLTLSSFSEVFNSLLPQEIEGLALPKYYYPSAGSLYPVQTYVSVNPGMIDGVPGGYYYYHPASHSLELLTARAQSENGFASGVGFSLHLVSDMSAIRPLYGAISEMFSHQEAGYMSNLLMQSTYQEVGLQVSPTVDKESIAKNFNLTSDHLHLVSFSGGKCTTEESKASLLPIFDTQPKKGESRLSLPERSGRDSVEISYLSRKSYREFEGQGSISTAAISRLLDSVFITGQGHTSTPEGLNVYLYVKEDKLEGLTGGAYYVDVANRALNYLGDQEATDLFAGNELIYDASGFAIMLTVNHSVVKSEEAKHEMMYWSGYIGQNLMNHSTEYQVGLCAVGSVDEALSRELLQLSSGEEVLHSFLGGKVTEEQIENTSQLTVGSQAQSPEELLKEYLSEQLPAYMIPKYYVQIDQIPLTANGKVNKKALPSPDIQMSEGYVAASNETEEQLVAIWSEVLDIDGSLISINSSFFELGGHSIKAIELANKINVKFDIQIPLKDMFENESVKLQADLIATNEWLFNKKDDVDDTERHEIVI